MDVVIRSGVRVCFIRECLTVLQSSFQDIPLNSDQDSRRGV